MPGPANPSGNDFYVYWFKVDGYPFYVGRGRAGRGPMREQYVKNIMRPENAEKRARADLCVRVYAELLDRGIKPDYFATDTMTLPEAKALEQQEIAQLVAQGVLLTNRAYNPRRPKDLDKAMAAILSKEMKPISN